MLILNYRTYFLLIGDYRICLISVNSSYQLCKIILTFKIFRKKVVVKNKFFNKINVSLIKNFENYENNLLLLRFLISYYDIVHKNVINIFSSIYFIFFYFFYRFKRIT